MHRVVKSRDVTGVIHDLSSADVGCARVLAVRGLLSPVCRRNTVYDSFYLYFVLCACFILQCISAAGGMQSSAPCWVETLLFSPFLGILLYTLLHFKFLIIFLAAAGG